MSRPTTILVLLDTVALRADVVWRRGRPAAMELARIDRGQAEAADAIDQLAAGGGFRGNVLVLSDEVFLQTIDLPAKAIAGLDRKALGHAIALEARSFSGIVGETMTEWTRRNDERGFLVAQSGRGDFASVAEAVERGGGRLIGIAHPAGVPLALDNAARTQGFHRCEDWGSVRASVRGKGQEAQRVKVLRSALPPGDVEGCTEHLVARTSLSVLAGPQRYELSDDDALSKWLRRWAESVTRPASLVLLTPPPTAAERNRRMLVAAVLVTLVVAAAILDKVTRDHELLAATTQLATARAPRDRLAAVEAESDVLSRQLAELQQAPAPRTQQAAGWSAQVLQVMLQSLAAERPAGVLLDELALGWRRCTVRGRTPDPASVDRWASALAPLLGKVGYTVLPGGRQQLKDQGGLFEFHLEFHSANAPVQPPLAEENGR